MSSALIDPIIILNSIEFFMYTAGCPDVDNTISDLKATFIYITLKLDLKSAACKTRQVWFYYRAVFFSALNIGT